jgi:TonB family protein
MRKGNTLRLKSTLVSICLLISTLTISAQTNLCVTSFVTPEYPQLAGSARVQGDVILQVTLNSDGSVSSSKVVSGHPLLRAAAQENSMSWRFETGDKKELADKEFSLRYRFRLSDIVRCDPQPTIVTIESYNLVSVLGSTPIICDPGIEIKKRHWYWPW